MTHSIGNHLFLALNGQVVLPTEQIVAEIARPGVDGVGLWKTGTRGVPFSLRSAVDQPTFAGCRTTYAAYRALIGADPVVLVKDSHDYNGSDNCKFAVLGVQLIEARQLANADGGLNFPSEAKLACLWDLIAIANTS